MARTKRTLKVLANPWLHLDHEDRPCCVIEREEMAGRWVGATPNVDVVGDAITVGTLAGYVGGEAAHDVTWTFSDELQDVPDTGYYRDRIREGALVLVDPSDVARLGLTQWTQDPKTGQNVRIPIAAGKSALAPNPNTAAVSTPTNPQPARHKVQEST
jgi:hypothetical protein